MSQRSANVHAFFEDILQSCEHIQQFTLDATESDFSNNVMMQYSVIRAVEILGEASKQIMDAMPDAPSRFPEIPFKKMYATRNRFIHGYSSLDAATVWRIVSDQVPPLHRSVKSILANWPSDLT